MITVTWRCPQCDATNRIDVTRHPRLAGNYSGALRPCWDCGQPMDMPLRVSRHGIGTLRIDATVQDPDDD